MKSVVLQRYVIVLVLAALLMIPLAPATGDERIEANVYAELEKSDTESVYVIVMLQPVNFRNEKLNVLKDTVRQKQEEVLQQFAPGEFDVVYRYKTFAGMTGYVTGTGLAKLAATPEIRCVGLDAAVKGTLSVSVPFINADDVHALGVTGQGITVAVLDTGIDTNHPDLSDNIAAGAFTFLVAAGGGTGPGAEDDNGHGTNVSGIITSKGVVAPLGVAPDADILAVKVLDSNSSGFVSDWVAGVDYVVNNKASYANLCAINMSLGTFSLFSACPCDNSAGFNMAAQASLLAAKNSGIVTFVSSGNAGSCTSMASPACLSAATAVAAVYDQNLGREPNSGTYQSNFGSSFGACFDGSTVADKITCFSNRLNGCNDLAAPGRLISAPGIGGGISTFTGTSQASPHCAGVAALMCEKCTANSGTLTPEQIVQTMKDTGAATDDPCATSPNPIRVDALAAVNAVCTCPLTGDIDGNGQHDGNDIAGYVRAKLGDPPAPGENPICADYASGTLSGDTALFVADLLN